MKITIEIPTAGESHIVVPGDSSPKHQDALDRINAELQAQMEIHPISTWERIVASGRQGEIDRLKAGIQEIHALLDSALISRGEKDAAPLKKRIEWLLEYHNACKRERTAPKAFRVPAKGDKLRCIKCTPQMSGNVQVGELIEFTGDDLFFGTNSYAMPLSCFEPV